MRKCFKYKSISVTIFGVLCFLIFAISCSKVGDRHIEAVDSFNKGVKAVKSDNLDLAGFYFRRAIILNPDFKEARLNLANVFFLDGNLDAAREEYIKLISERTEDPRIYFNLAWIYLSQDNISAAKKYLDTLQKRFPNFSDTDYCLAVLSQKDGEEYLAKFYLEKYLKNESGGRWSEKAKLMLSEIEQKLNVQPTPVQLAEAFHTEDTLEILPTTQTQEQVNDNKPSAVVEPTKIVERPRSNEKTKPEASPKNVKPEEAKQHKSKETILKIIDEGFKALDKSDFNTAELKFKDALELDDKSISALHGLAKLYFLMNKPSDEKKWVAQMIKSSGANPNNFYDLAKGYEKIGDIKSAIEYYRKYLSSEPFGSKADDAKKRLTELDKLSESE